MKPHTPRTIGAWRDWDVKVLCGRFECATLEGRFMAQYTAEVLWLRGEQDFLSNRYSRRHVLRFDGGIEVPGSSSPQAVPLPMSDAAAVDPEEAFVSSLSSCHMLWFLSLAAKRRFCVDRYFDAAVGVMEKNSDGRMIMSVVTLKPEVQFSGDPAPTREQIDELHHQAHKECFIANSVKTEVRCEPVYVAL
jgi:organic hydroperoxide reductase OsmC/OhrA